MKKSISIIVLCCVLGLFSSLKAQQSKLQSGPMIGYVEVAEVMLWAQTTEEAEVYIEYVEVNKPENIHRTNTVNTKKENAYTAKLLADQIKEGKTYNYTLFVNGIACEFDFKTQFTARPLWQWRRDPPSFSFATGSCMYVNEPEVDRPGTPYGSEYFIFEKIVEKKPDFMFWLGDNVYLREVDWNTKTGIYHRYTHSRSINELQELLATTPNYAIWDDHDYGPNNSDRSYPYKDLTFQAFNDFWCNPNIDVTGEGGITGVFEWADCSFYMMDDRYHRTPNSEPSTVGKTMYGRKQLEWMLDHMASDPSAFKFVAMGNQVLTPVESDENLGAYPEDKEYIISEIKRRKITGVVFLTGDRHHTELTKLDVEGAYPLYDFTCSAFTSGTHRSRDEGNYLQVPNTLVNEHNYGLIKVDGARKERVMTIQVLNNKNELKWEYKIKASDLDFK